MTGDGIRIRDELYLSLRSVADCYEVELEWLIQVYDSGLLGQGERVAEETVISSVMLDRVAEVRWLHQIAGVNLAGIVLLLNQRDGRNSR